MPLIRIADSDSKLEVRIVPGGCVLVDQDGTEVRGLKEEPLTIEDARNLLDFLQNNPPEKRGEKFQARTPSGAPEREPAGDVAGRCENLGGEKG